MSCGNIHDENQGGFGSFSGSSLNYITAIIGTADQLIGVVPANRMISRIHIDIIDEYDSPVFINVGDDSAWARLWRFGDSLLSGQIYTKLTDFKYLVPTPITWRFEVLPSSGSATITIHFS